MPVKKPRRGIQNNTILHAFSIEFLLFYLDLKRFQLKKPKRIFLQKILLVDLFFYGFFKKVNETNLETVLENTHIDTGVVWKKKTKKKGF